MSEWSWFSVVSTWCCFVKRWYGVVALKAGCWLQGHRGIDVAGGVWCCWVELDRVGPPRLCVVYFVLCLVL